MDFGPIVLALNVLLLLAGWLLFQQAKSELTARAAETSVLKDLAELRQGVEQLIQKLETDSIELSAAVEERCDRAKELLAELDARTPMGLPPAEPEPTKRARAAKAKPEPKEPDLVDGRYAAVYALADTGKQPGAIAAETGFSEGEIELILGVRRSVLSTAVPS